MPQFVPHCPLKNEKGLRQHPFTINHYSLYNSPIGFYGNDSPAGVPWLPVHLKEAGELQCKETGLCSTQHSSCTALPALDTLLGPAKRELHPPQTGETALLHWFTPPGKSPKFLQPYPKPALLEGSTQHLTGMAPHTCPLSHSSEHPCEGTEDEAVMAVQPQGGGLWLCCSQCTLPQVCPLLPCEQHLTCREGSAPGEPPPLPQVSNRPSSGCVSGFQREIRTPSCPASSHSHLLLHPDRAVTQSELS